MTIELEVVTEELRPLTQPNLLVVTSVIRSYRSLSEIKISWNNLFYRLSQPNLEVVVIATELMEYDVGVSE